MRQPTSVALGVILSLGLLIATSMPANAAVAGGGYDSRYSGESVFTSEPAGQTGQFSAIFYNAGTQPWAPGVIGLMVCLADQVTCNVPSPNASYARNWYSPTVYATVTVPVLPGQNGFFVYDFIVPVETAPNTVATFNGDIGLLATGASLHPEGYFQQNLAPYGSGPAAIGTFDPPVIASDGVSTATLTVTVVDQTGNSSPAYGSSAITVTRQGTLVFCALTAVTLGANANARPGVASATGGVVQFTVASTTLPGTCLLSITTGNAAIAGSTASLTTRVVGPGAVLAVSRGAAGSHPAAIGGSCTLAGVVAHNNDDPSCTVVTVEVRDVNGLRVTGDNRSVVTATLDSATCSGGGRGSVILQGATASGGLTATSTASGGRATFVLSSTGPYPSCRMTFTAPSLAPTSTSEAWTGP